jgi:type IV pilus assembly protein PilE
MKRTSLSPHRSAHTGGFTLIEVLCVMGIMGVLASIAVPNFQGALHKGRRIDGISALMQAHVQQERWHANHGRYASGESLRLAARSSMGHYAVAVREAEGQRVVLTATAQGPQAGDRECRVLRVVLERGQMQHQSGPDAETDNTAAVNRRCWGK